MMTLTFITVVLGLVGMSHVISAVVLNPTGTFVRSTLGQCNINLKAMGNPDTGANVRRSAYIKINNVTYFDSFNGNPVYRGFDLMILDMNTCRASNFSEFDTWGYADASTALADYISKVPAGAHIIGVTSDDAFNTIQNSAKEALQSIGVNVTGLTYHDKTLFHAIKGKPEKTVQRTGKSGGENLYYEEKANDQICQHGGFLKVNSAGTCIECQCEKGFTGLFCEN